MTAKRKYGFYAEEVPDAGDAALDAILAAVPARARGRLLRSLALAGASMKMCNDRLPSVLAALAAPGLRPEDVIAAITAVLGHTTAQLPTTVEAPAPLSPPAEEEIQPKAKNLAATLRTMSSSK